MREYFAHHREKSMASMTDVKPVFDDDATKGIIGKSHVSELFFSEKNLEALQHGIRYGVFKKTCGKHVIGNQSIEQLYIIMRSIYLQYSRNLPYDIVGQVRELNGRVLEFAVHDISKELDMYDTYIKEASSLPVPLERSENVSIKGDRSFEFKGFL